MSDFQVSVYQEDQKHKENVIASHLRVLHIFWIYHGIVIICDIPRNILQEMSIFLRITLNEILGGIDLLIKNMVL